MHNFILGLAIGVVVYPVVKAAIWVWANKVRG
jgi:hypothetical protein